MKKIPTLGLAMITKNEEKYLSKCLDSVIDIIDEIVIVDSGSTDKTLDIAKRYNAHTYYKEWENDFSKARNYALSKATTDWVLLLDADEEVDKQYKLKILDLIESEEYDGYYSKIYNYYGSSINDGYVIHTAFRLLRNNKKYFFRGSIHEQITPCSEEHKGIFNMSDIIIHHYGYLDENITIKKKRERNIPLLEKELQLSPNNPFYMYSLANEYAALKENDLAIELYEKARLELNTTHGFASSLYYKLITVLYNNKNYNIARLRVNEANILFPKCVDFHYLNGLINRQMYNYTIAMDSLNKCIELGDTPMKFMDGCGTYLPYIVLGDIFQEINDYTRAINSYNNAVIINRRNYQLLYTICDLLLKKYKNSIKVIENIKSYFSDLEDNTNKVLYLDILLSNNILDELYEDISCIENNKNIGNEDYYILAKYNFKNKNYDKALGYLNSILLDEAIITEKFLTNYKLMYLTSLLILQKDLNIIPNNIRVLFNDIVLKFFNTNTNIINASNNNIDISMEAYDFIISIYDILLEEKETSIFNKYIVLLDYIQNERKYLDMAKVLYRNNFKSQALIYIKESISKFDNIDKECSRILLLES